MNIFEQRVETGDDVFAVRQRARRIAEALGFDAADQVRIATALSEVARDVLGEHGGNGTISFRVDGAPQRFVIVVDGLHHADIDRDLGTRSARRLMPVVEVHPHEGAFRLVMSRPLPSTLETADARQLGATIARQVVSSPLDELRTQNRELAAALEDLTARQHELVALNGELEATNRGVMAMYAQLSDELDSTNRGVVALYAELDDASRRLEQANAAKTRFLANVSHELRSPLTAIIGLAQLLLDDDHPRARESSLIHAAANELLGLVNELLDLAKAESGRIDPHFARVEVGAIITDVVDSFRPLAADGVELRTEMPDAPLEVAGDEALLRHAVRNLVANATTFTERGSVVVSARRVDASIEIAVADTGIGIAPEHLDRVFEEFFQVRSPIQAGRRGTGLGLAYSRAVTEALGGTLTATSTLGAGSTFTMRLPDPTAGAAEPELVRPARHGAGR